MLRSGVRLAPVEVAYETYGSLSAQRDNAVFVCHALTGDAHAAGHHGNPSRRGWWDTLIGPGKPVDTDRWFVVCPNLLGGCQGTTGPREVDGPFPDLVVRDLVAVHRRLLEHLGIGRLAAAIGGSLGGMQVLQWALDQPHAMRKAVLVCATARLSAMNIAFSVVGREAIARAGPVEGLRIARMAAHLTYLSEASMERKFDRERRADGMFQVESYLRHQGEAILERFHPGTYVVLSRLMDEFEPFAEPGARDAVRALAAAGTRCSLTSFSTDWRFGAAHSEHIARELRAGGVDVDHAEVDSPWGHDSFLLDVPAYHERVRAFLEQP